MTFHWWHVIIALIPMLPSFWAIWDVWKRSFPSFQQKALWLCLVVFLPVLGGLVYIIHLLLAGRRQARS